MAQNSASDRSLNLRVGALLALCAYLPILATQPGWISADTKTYLTLDPGRLMTRAWSMWDPMVGAGTVTHQNIGYLFPLGPLYWIAEAARIPDWVTQRLLWGTILWVAAFGTWKLCRWLGWSTLASLVAAVAYGWSPYLLSYLARISAILLPWAALPWLIIFASLAVRESRWRGPARFALVIALVGSVNATSLLLVGLGPVLWVLAESWGGRHRFGAVVAGGARTLVLTLGVSVWWILGLWIQGAYGMPILDYTETYQVVASSSTPQEVLRGLGYWFFYGGDRLGPWVGPSRVYLSPWMIALGTILAGISLLGLCTAFAGRGRTLVLLVSGLALAVGAAPLGASTPYGAGFLRFSTTTVGMAMRSTPRAAPLVVLAMAIGLGAAVQWARVAVDQRRARSERIPVFVVPLLAIAVCGGLFAQMHPWFTGGALTDSILRPSELPEYRRQLATWLEETGEGRVWEIPGADFGSYLWGGTVDPVLPGMIDRPTFAREIVPQGGAGTAGLLAALDTRIHEGTFEPESLLAVARLFGVQTIVMRGDLQHERYRLVRPGSLWPRLLDALGPPDFVGPMTTDQPVILMIDEIFLADSRRVESYPILAAWNLDDAQPKSSVSPAPVVVVRSGSATVIAGDGEGIVDSAAAGLLDPDRPLIFTASGLNRDLWGPRPHLIVTDTNAKRARRWSTLSANYGVLETPEEVAIAGDVGDQRLDLFPTVDVEMQTTMVHTGAVAAIRATSYGNRFSFTPEDAAHFAMDGDPTTAWRTAVFSDLRGQQLEIDLKELVSVDQIRILQPITRVVTRYLTEIQLHFDSGASMRVTLDDSSRSLPGQLIPVPTTPFRSLRVGLIADNLGNASVFAAQPGVGIAEIQIGDRRALPTVQMPTAWLNEVADLNDLEVDLVMTRRRIDPSIPNRGDPEPHLDRSFDLPAARNFVVEGTARISAIANDQTIAALWDLVHTVDTVDTRSLGPSAQGSVWASTRMAGSVESWGRAALDGDPNTAWVTPFGLRLVDGTRPPGGQDPVLIMRPSSPVSRWEEMRLTWQRGQRHSLPRIITVRGSDGGSITVDLFAASDGEAVVNLQGLQGDQIELRIAEADPQFAPDYISGVPRMLPVAISEIVVTDAEGQPVTFGALPERLPERCRYDLMEIDGQAIGVRLRGETQSVLGRAPIRVEPCDAPLTLGPGTHRVVAVSPMMSGVDLDRVVLRSTLRAADTTQIVAPVVVERLGPERIRVVVDPGAEGWLILRESLNPGWVARDQQGSLGDAVLIDGYAHGWPLLTSSRQQEIMLEWTPQRVIRPGLVVSGLFLLLTIGLSCGWLTRPKIFGSRSNAAHVVSVRASRARDPKPLMVGAGLIIVGGPIAGGTYLLLRWCAGTDRWAQRWLPAATAFALWGITALYTAALQFGYGYPADPDWPSRFEWMSPVAWAAVAAVIAAQPRLGCGESDQ